MSAKLVRLPLFTLIFQSPDSINFWTVPISTVLVFGGIPRTRELIAPFILNVLVGFIVAVIVCADTNPIKQVKIVVTVMATTIILIYICNC